MTNDNLKIIEIRLSCKLGDLRGELGATMVDHGDLGQGARLLHCVNNGRNCVFQDGEDLRRAVVPVVTLSVMLLSAVALLVVAQFPTVLNSVRTRFALGLLASGVLGLGCVVLGAPLPAFVAVLAVLATLPRVRRHKPSVFGFCLGLVYLGTRIAHFLNGPADQLKLYQVRTEFVLQLFLSLIVEHFPNEKQQR